VAADDAGDARDSPGRAYLFDNAAQQTSTRFNALPALFDPETIRHLSELGVGAGWRCLEIGGGGGSIAQWLSERVGPVGRVLATDIDTRFLETLGRPNLEVRRHNIVTDPLPQAAFDLAHTRLLLMHLPEREKALERIVAALKPGGWLLAEEFDAYSMRPDAGVNPVELFSKTNAAVQRVMMESGVDLRYGRLLPGRLRAHGLVDIAAEGRMFLWQPGTLTASLWRANYEQLREAILAAGYVTPQEFEQHLALLDRGDFMNPSPVMWSVWGRRAP